MKVSNNCRSRLQNFRNGAAVEANNIWTTITYTGLRESGDSGMNDVTGVFTAPIAGTYEFHYEAVKVCKQQQG